MQETKLSTLNEPEETLLHALARIGIKVTSDDLAPLARAFEVRRQRAAKVHEFPAKSSMPAFNYIIPGASR